MPAKKRVIKTDAAFLPSAVPIETRACHNTAGKMLTLRPQISEIGSQMTGPVTKPSLLTGNIQNRSLLAHPYVFGYGIIGRGGDA
ncbi:hypothetical protein BBP40_008836 [Aspergillus hancockii]|nr:hypothetical protein BBP40_008836 [Aspergillus hancockii]